MTHNSTIFEAGDLVRHRASGRVAVVTAKLWHCIKHPPLAMCFMRLDRSECELEPSGRYDLSFDFDEIAEAVDGVLLEPVDNNE